MNPLGEAIAGSKRFNFGASSSCSAIVLAQRARLTDAGGEAITTKRRAAVAETLTGIAARLR